MRKIYSFLLLGLLLSIGNAWAAFEKATSIAVGDQVVLVVEKSTTLMELSSISTTSTKYGIGTAYTETPAGMMLFDVVEGKTEGTFAFKNGNNYLYWGSGNSLATNATLSANSSWTVSFNGTTATITNAQQATRVIWWNASSPRFACYENKSDGNAYYSVQLYKKITTGVPDPTFSPAAGTYSSAQSVELACENDGATIYYTTDGTDPTNASTPYTGTIAVSATTTIKAIAYVGENASTVASAEYRIVTIEHAGTEQDPYTVADARNAIDLGTGLTDVYATGIVSEIVDDYSTTFYNITFDIIDEGGSDVLRAYRCGGAEAANVEVGDTVVVSGTLVNYNSVYEFSQGCQIVSLKHPVAPAVPSIDVEETSINVPYTGALDGVINVTYNNITEIVADIEFFEEDGTTPLAQEPNWIITDIDIQTHNLVYVVDVNEGAARTAYLKVYALDDESNEVYSELITITQAACAYAVLPFYFNDGRADIENTPGLTQDGLDSDYGSSPKLKFNTTGDYLVLKINENPGLLLFDIKGNGFSSGSTSTFKIQTSVNGQDYSDLKTYTELSDTQTEHFNLASTVRYIKWIYIEKGASSGGNVALGNIKLLKPVKLGANGYSTFAADFNYTVSGADAYKAEYDEQQNAIVLTQVNVIEAGEGIVLKGANAGDVVTITPSNATADDFIDNELVGVLSPIEAEANYYVLATIDQDGITKFHPCYAGITIPANKAFIEIGEATAPSAIRIEFAENNATNIMNVDDVENAVKFMENGKLFIKKNGVIYNAVGAKVK